MRNRTESRHIEGTMMGRSVFTYQSGTVKTHDNRQVEQCHVVDDVIVGTLCKRTVDIAEWDETVFRHTS